MTFRQNPQLALKKTTEQGKKKKQIVQQQREAGKGKRFT